MSMRKKIIEWSAEQWPQRTQTSVKAKLLEELQELKEAIEKDDTINIAEELFDVYAMVIDYAHRHNVSLKKMFAAKRIIVNARKINGKDKKWERELLGEYL